jgi:hypothetical protein
VVIISQAVSLPIMRKELFLTRSQHMLILNCSVFTRTRLYIICQDIVIPDVMQ